jgi:lysophospholipase L1-like esterase
MPRHATLRLAVLPTALLLVHAAAAPVLPRHGERILFCGDSITGQGGNSPDGYCRQVEAALQAVYPGASNRVAVLGGSGQTVGSWLNLATRATNGVAFLDVPGVEVRATLDAGTDVLFVMLGMNDLLRPAIGDTPESLRAWREQYVALLRTLRDRTRPRVTALGTVTLLTEALQSPKNRVRVLMNRQVREIAAAEGLLVCDTGEATERLLWQGRSLDPDFHVAPDLVHPAGAGHAAIAAAILEGLGEEAAARIPRERCAAHLAPTDAYPTLSYDVTSVRQPADAPSNTYAITYWWTSNKAVSQPPAISLAIPDGWRIERQTHAATSGVFTLNGVPDRLINALTLTAKAGDIERTRRIAIPAPWRVSAGLPNPAAWARNPTFHYDPSNSVQDVDLPLIRGEGFDAPLAGKDRAVSWTIYTPSVNYTGGRDPGSLDAFALAFGGLFESVRAARWIHSARARTVEIALSSSVFAGQVGVCVWVNGRCAYAGAITSEPKRQAVARAELTSGWNRLFVKFDHLEWQCQCACSLRGVDGDDLDDLRYSAVPPEADVSRERTEK